MPKIEFLKTNDLAELFGRHPITIRNWVKAGLLPEPTPSPNDARENAYDAATVLAMAIENGLKMDSLLETVIRENI